MSNDEFQYAMAVMHRDPYDTYDAKYVWGFCILSKCDQYSLKSMQDFFNSTLSKVSGINDAKIEYILPSKDLETYKAKYFYPFIILSVIMLLTMVLGLLGIAVEYTSLGTTKLTHEDTNFNNIDIPIIYEGTTYDQLRQIMMIKDELLRNSKKLWASIVLCFSLTRNLRHLFYNYKI
jgi:hypothetical protein